MEKVKRKIFFWILVILFFIIAPSLVLYANGYRFDLKKGVFVHSGTISLKVNPRNVAIFLNGKEEEVTTSRINNSLNIFGLMPREYNLKISADGFNEWSKKTEVHSGMASEFWNILLTRKEYEKTPYESGPLRRFFISPEDRLIALVNQPEIGTEVKILDIKDAGIQKTFLFEGWSFIAEERKENIEWSPKEDYLLIPLEKKNAFLEEEGGKEKIFSYFVADPDKGTYFNLNEFIGKSDLRNVRWDPEEKDYVFFLEGTNLYRSSIKKKEDFALVSQEVSSFDLAKTGVYYSQLPNELVFRKDLNGETGKTQITFDSPKKTDSLNEKLIVYDELRIAFLDKNKNLYLLNKGEHKEYLEKIDDNIEGVQFSDDGKKLLFWKENEISVFFLRDWNVQPLRVENETKNITRYSEKISNVQWFKDYEHVIFSVGPFVKIIELDNRDRRICQDILTTESLEPKIVYNHYLEKMFFSDWLDESRGSFFSINIPEETNLLGL